MRKPSVKTLAQVFEVGQLVVSKDGYYGLLVEGKTYTVTDYQPEDRDINFTWPAYVSVLDDKGKKVTGHAYRFTPAPKEQPE